MIESRDGMPHTGRETGPRVVTWMRGGDAGKREGEQHSRDCDDLVHAGRLTHAAVRADVVARHISHLTQMTPDGRGGLEPGPYDRSMNEKADVLRVGVGGPVGSGKT